MNPQNNPEIFLKEFISRIIIEKAGKIREENKKAEKLFHSTKNTKKEETTKKLLETPIPSTKKVDLSALDKLLTKNPLPPKPISRVIPIQKPQNAPKETMIKGKDSNKKPLLPPITPPNINIQNKNVALEQLNFKSLEKLKLIIDDPAVISIECAGAGKNIIVNSGGLMKNTQIVLTQQEINAIMKDISDKTKIPLSAGVFKAVIGRYLINAVISDFVGTRFVITKRTPFMKY